MDYGNQKTKKRFGSILALFFSFSAAFCTLGGTAGCAKEQSGLDQNNPVTLKMWHVYGEQADSPMNARVEEFNRTVGKENGVILNVTLMSNAAQIGGKLAAAQADIPGAPDMPDLFFCHASDARTLGADTLLNWKTEFSADELSAFVPDFLADGMLGDALAVLPVSKSTHLLFVAGGAFDRFAAEKGISYNDLATWDGFFDVAEKYYDYSGGKPFCALDYLLRAAELNALSLGSGELYAESGWYDTNNEAMLSSFGAFAEAIAKGYIAVSDLYSNTQVMTGETIAGIGSSASVLYYNDKITYPDNTSEDTDLRVLPLPQAKDCFTSGATAYDTQAGVGLCAYKTDGRKAAAASLFARWFTEEERNLDFVAATGYMPVRQGAFDKIAAYGFTSPSYERLYAALRDTKNNCVLLSEPQSAEYFSKTYKLYAEIRKVQKNLDVRYAQGETSHEIAAEITQLFINVH